MKIKQNQPKRSHWQRRPLCANPLKSWLIDSGSLTARLKTRYADFAVQPQLMRYGKAFCDEHELIGLQGRQYALIREVLLMGGKQPVVFAHSVLPQASLRGPWAKLGRLGNKPLGAALFANPKVKRTPLQYKKLSAYSPISMRLAGLSLNNAQVSKKQQLWARRSVFSLGCAKILVTEVFLASILAP